MSSYLTFGTNNFDESKVFYDAVLSTIGWSSHAEFPGWRAYSEGGKGEGCTVWLCTPFDGAKATAGNGTMFGFMATSREQVDAFHAAAMANGGQDEGVPGVRLDYGPDWYAAYLRDPTGNKFAVVYRP